MTVSDRIHHLARTPALRQPMKKYHPTDEVDFVIVGSGAAGGVLARELSRSGFSVVVLEQGPWLTEKDFSHDPLNSRYNPKTRLDSNRAVQPQTFRASDTETARRRGFAWYGRVVGGGTVHFGAHYRRALEIEFERATRLGVPDGSSVADWPISYKDLEPYYTKVDWEIGLSGKAGNPFEAPRSRGYPVPPLPAGSVGVLCERGARKLGWLAWPDPMAILSRPYRGRAACVQCGRCTGYGCEVQAKSSTLVAMIPAAVATRRCEIRPNSYVRRVEMGVNGRVTGVTYFDQDKKDVFQRARAVVLSANGVETPKLLLLSATSAFADGLANSSGQVGRNFMGNVLGGANALFDHEINGWRHGAGGSVIFDFLEAPAQLGLYGGGGLGLGGGGGAGGSDPNGGSWPGEPRWGSEWKKRAKYYFCNSASAGGVVTQLPVSTNRVDLDPVEKDAWGLPAPRLTFTQHPLDMKLGEWFGARARELLQAAGAAKVSESYVVARNTAHLLGTCRMGNDPKRSVVDADHRAHDVPNLFIVDGSSFVTSGPAPTLTIQALAFRAADRITHLARTRSI
jgi:choline dehydrogenase-like flavoprotein